MEDFDQIFTSEITSEKLISLICDKLDFEPTELSSKFINACTEKDFNSKVYLIISDILTLDCFSSSLYVTAEKKMKLLSFLVEYLLIENMTIDEYGQKLKSFDYSETCSLVWKSNYFAYRCRTCSLSPTMSLCAHCFHSGNHEGHDFNKFRSLTGGVCDCGDLTVIKSSGNCRFHGFDKINLRPAIPDNIREPLNVLLPPFICGLVTYLLDTCENTDVNQGKLDKLPALHFLHGLNAFGWIVQQTLADILTNEELFKKYCKDQKNRSSLRNFQKNVSVKPCFIFPDFLKEENLVHKNFLDLFMFITIKLRFPENLVTFLIGLFSIASYKEKFMQAYIDHYTRMATFLITIACSKRRDLQVCMKVVNQIAHISVQLFSGQDTALRMVKQRHLHLINIYCILNVFYITKARVDKFLNWTVDVDSVFIKNNILWPLISDMTMFMSHKKIVDYIATDQDFLQAWTKVLAALQFMNVNRKKQGEHITFETMAFHHAYNLEMEISVNPMWNIWEHYYKNIDLNPLYLFGVACIQKMRKILKTYGKITLNDQTQSKNSRLKVSFHMPLSRHCASIISLLTNERYHCTAIASQQMGLINLQDGLFKDFELKLIRRWLEEIVNIMLASQEIMNGLWVRNGNPIRQSAFNYLHNKFSYSYIDLDIFTVQICASQTPPYYLLASLLNENSLLVDIDLIKELSSLTHLNVLDKDGKSLAAQISLSTNITRSINCINSLLTLFSWILDIRNNINVDENEMLEKEVISLLALQNLKHSDFNNHLPLKYFTSELNIKTKELDNILERVADFVQPSCDTNLNCLTSGYYTLKTDYWLKNFDFVFQTLRANNKVDLVQLAKFYRSKIKGKYPNTDTNSIWFNFKEPKPLPVSFKDLELILLSKHLLYVLYILLSLHLHNNPLVNEDNLSYVIHLLMRCLKYSTTLSYPLDKPQYQNLKINQSTNERQSTSKMNLDDEIKDCNSLVDSFSIDPIEYCRNFFNSTHHRDESEANLSEGQSTTPNMEDSTSDTDLADTEASDGDFNTFQQIIGRFISQDDMNEEQRIHLFSITARLRQFRGIFNDVISTSHLKRSHSQLSEEDDRLAAYESPSLPAVILSNPYRWSSDDKDFEIASPELDETSAEETEAPKYSSSSSTKPIVNLEEKTKYIPQILNEISLEKPITWLMSQYICTSSLQDPEYARVFQIDPKDFNLLLVNKDLDTIVDSIISLLIKVHSHLYCSNRMKEDPINVVNIAHLGSVLVLNHKMEESLSEDSPMRAQFLSNPPHLRFFTFHLPFYQAPSSNSTPTPTGEYYDGVYYVENLLNSMYEKCPILRQAIDEYLEQVKAIIAPSQTESMEVDDADNNGETEEGKQPVQDLDFKTQALEQQKRMMMAMEAQKNAFIKKFMTNEMSTVTGQLMDDVSSNDEGISNQTTSDTCPYYCVICQSSTLSVDISDKQIPNDNSPENTSSTSITKEFAFEKDSFVMFSMISESSILNSMRPRETIPMLSTINEQGEKPRCAHQAINVPESFQIIPEYSDTCQQGLPANEPDHVAEKLHTTDELLKPKPVHVLESNNLVQINGVFYESLETSRQDILPFLSFQSRLGPRTTPIKSDSSPRPKLPYESRRWWDIVTSLSIDLKAHKAAMPLLKPGLIIQTCGHCVHRACLTSYKLSVSNDSPHISCPLCRRVVHHVVPIYKKPPAPVMNRKMTSIDMLKQIADIINNLPDIGTNISFFVDSLRETTRLNKKIFNQLCGKSHQGVVLLRSQLEAELSVLLLCPNQFSSFAKRCQWNEFIQYVGKLYSMKCQFSKLIPNLLGNCSEPNALDECFKLISSDTIDVYLSIVPYLWPQKDFLQVWTEAMFCINYSRQLFSLLLNQKKKKPLSEFFASEIPIDPILFGHLKDIYQQFKEIRFISEYFDNIRDRRPFEAITFLAVPNISCLDRDYLFGTYLVASLLPYLRIAALTAARWQSTTVPNWTYLVLGLRMPEKTSLDITDEFKDAITMFNIKPEHIDEFFMLMKFLEFPAPEEKVTVDNLTKSIISISVKLFEKTFTQNKLDEPREQNIVSVKSLEWINNNNNIDIPKEYLGPLLVIGRELYSPRLYRLPKSFDDLFNKCHSIPCSVRNHEFQENALCLVCGQLICIVCSSSMTNSLLEHSYCCSGFNGVMIEINSSIVYVSLGVEVCTWGSVYLDSYGEEDHNLFRGKPLFLNEERLNLLEKQWVTHSFRYVLNKWSSSN